jgi:hypothetical protein
MFTGVAGCHAMPVVLVVDRHLHVFLPFHVSCQSLLTLAGDLRSGKQQAALVSAQEQTFLLLLTTACSDMTPALEGKIVPASGHDTLRNFQ